MKNVIVLDKGDYDSILSDLGRAKSELEHLEEHYPSYCAGEALRMIESALGTLKEEDDF